MSFFNGGPRCSRLTVLDGWWGYKSPPSASPNVALIIDAMAEMYARRVDAFCFAFGDGDLTRLAIAARERGFPVLVFGGPSSPSSLRNACTEFHVLRGGSGGRVKPTKRAKKGREGNSSVQAMPLNTREDFVGFVRDLVSTSRRTTIQAINHDACKRDQTFSARRFAAGGLKALLRTIDEIELCPVTDAKGVVRDYEVCLSKHRLIPTEIPDALDEDVGAEAENPLL